VRKSGDSLTAKQQYDSHRPGGLLLYILTSVGRASVRAIGQSRLHGGSILGTGKVFAPPTFGRAFGGTRLWRVAQNPDEIRVRDEIENSGEPRMRW